MPDQSGYDVTLSHIDVGIGLENKGIFKCSLSVYGCQVTEDMGANDLKMGHDLINDFFMK